MALGIYLHVPFCSSRCGYCDFNTYTATELGGGGSIAEYASVVQREFDRAIPAISGQTVTTVFFGGGTPTLLTAGELTRMLSGLAERFEFAPDAEITTECNPDSVDAQYIEALRDAGFTRISFGMQSAASHVLTVLERTHTPGRSTEMARLARAVGFEHVSLDLIYGTPGERERDLVESVQTAIDAGIDHLSAYSLIVEPNTRLAGRVARGELTPLDDDILADRYVMIDELLSANGFEWYEVSNWAKPGGACQHNLGYWTGRPWWGFGPGAHSYLSDRRWWNVKHPSAYATALSNGESIVAGEEVLSAADKELERIMLELRLSSGVTAEGLNPITLSRLLDDGLLMQRQERFVLTRTGRLLADAVIREFATSPSEY